ncbi:protein delta homolog 2 [Seriola aureovittata]|uniref:protein delta homolog 2 n=1 Tax=Seriola aureovittata TaxID=2871759 RepID=UPI0024BD88AB|nr:protein delta homolog 2 [Seriola aureovittata]XP_056252052.1 protein delta homolog 2 [Seriola aureovittata]
MSAVRAAAVLLPLSVCVLAALLVPPCTGQGSDCSCNITNSHCDESGVCRCDPGWDGERCDRCVPMPGCVHGSCQQPWQCSCEPGWGGRFCDKDLFVCSEQQPCHNGATCVMEDSGEYTCLCPEGFHGRDCQLKTGPCHQRRSPCKNGGLCEDADGFAEELTCRCLAGFTGPRCETDINDCLMKPCGNGATCLDGVNRFSCLCPAGFTGRFCTVNLDDCASRPCLNAGRCLDRAGGFHCVCRPGYTGVTCETLLRNQDVREPGWTTHRWEGGGGGRVRHHTTTAGKNQRTSSNSSRHDNRLFKVTVSERGASGLTEVQLIVLLVLAGLTLTVVVLTVAFVLQGHCRKCGHAPCWPLTSSSSPSSSRRGQKSRQRAQPDEQDCQISFLNAAEPEKKKLNTEVI